MDIKNVTVAGAGILGSQIAWQTAFSGFNVVVYDPYEESIEKSKKFHQGFAKHFVNKRGASEEQTKLAFSRLSYTTDMKEAFKDTDILSESIPENLDIKKSFYTELSKIAPEKTIFTTNSSTMLPSMYAKETGRPEKFLALHFANPIWDGNVGEVMKHQDTDPIYFDIVLEFAKQIGMVPIPIKKEKSGYVLNSLLIPLLTAAQDLLFDGVSDYESIDKTWMISSGSKIGPFGILDLIGMQTVYNIAYMTGKSKNNQKILDRAQMIKEQWIDKGKMGLSTGEGFYKYPNPAYKSPDFLK